MLALLLACLQYTLWLGNGGQREVAALRAQVATQQAREPAACTNATTRLPAEVEDLKSGEAAVEERARSELGMVKPGETFYRVIEGGNPQPAAPESETPR